MIFLHKSVNCSGFEPRSEFKSGTALITHFSGAAFFVRREHIECLVCLLCECINNDDLRILCGVYILSVSTDATLNPSSFHIVAPNVDVYTRPPAHLLAPRQKAKRPSVSTK